MPSKVAVIEVRKKFNRKAVQKSSFGETKTNSEFFKALSIGHVIYQEKS